MVLAGNEGPSQSELQRTINMLIERQTRIDKRVERLETLEGTKWDDGRGCVSFEDYDQVAGAATARVDVDPEFAENGDFKASQAILFWQGWHENAGAVWTNLYMRINNQVDATYDYAYKYTKGGVIIPGNLDNQTAFFVGRIGGVFGEVGGFSYGQVIVPFYPLNLSFHQIFGDWSGKDSGPVNTTMEKGEYSGYKGVAPLSINRFDFFPAAGQFNDFVVYLYIWCPQLTAGFLPDD